MRFHTMADFAHSLELNPLAVSNQDFTEHSIWKMYGIHIEAPEPQPTSMQLRKLFAKCALAVAGEENANGEEAQANTIAHYTPHRGPHSGPA